MFSVVQEHGRQSRLKVYRAALVVLGKAFMHCVTGYAPRAYLLQLCYHATSVTHI